MSLAELFGVVASKQNFSLPFSPSPDAASGRPFPAGVKELIKLAEKKLKTRVLELSPQLFVHWPAEENPLKRFRGILLQHGEWSARLRAVA